MIKAKEDPTYAGLGYDAFLVRSLQPEDKSFISAFDFELTVERGAVSISKLYGVKAGVYTPTRSAEVNLDTNVTMAEAQYMRLGNTVTVSGQFTANPTTTTNATSFELTLPVFSNIGAVSDVAGVASSGAIVSMVAAITGVAANNTAKVFWVASDVASQVWSYVFSYQVID